MRLTFISHTSLLSTFVSNTQALSILMPRGVKKENLPIKICIICQRPFNWRKKWERCWDEVTTCSKSCNFKRKQSKSAVDSLDPDQFLVDDYSGSDNEVNILPLENINFNSIKHSQTIIHTSNNEDITTTLSSLHDETNADVNTSSLLLPNIDNISNESCNADINEMENNLSVIDETQECQDLIDGNHNNDDNNDSNDKKKNKKKHEIKRDISPIKTKTCEICKDEKLHLFRCQWDASRQWRFVCPQCWSSVSGSESTKKPLYNKDGSVKPPNPYYRYGGTWKALKK